MVDRKVRDAVITGAWRSDEWAAARETWDAVAQSINNKRNLRPPARPGGNVRPSWRRSLASGTAVEAAVDAMYVGHSTFGLPAVLQIFGTEIANRRRLCRYSMSSRDRPPRDARSRSPGGYRNRDRRQTDFPRTRDNGYASRDRPRPIGEEPQYDRSRGGSRDRKYTEDDRREERNRDRRRYDEADGRDGSVSRQQPP